MLKTYLFARVLPAVKSQISFVCQCFDEVQRPVEAQWHMLFMPLDKKDKRVQTLWYKLCLHKSLRWLPFVPQKDQWAKSAKSPGSCQSSRRCLETPHAIPWQHPSDSGAVGGEPSDRAFHAWDCFLKNIYIYYINIYIY